MPRKNIKNQANQNFYMLHKVLFINEKYKKLSDSAKVTYAILNDRVSLSIKNNWIDQNGDIYFIFTNENLQEVLDKSKNTITKIKKELQEAGLLEQVKTGFNRPNKLYLHEIETNITIEKEIQNSTSNDDESSDIKDSQILGVQNPKRWDSRIPNDGSPESQNLDPNDTEFSNTDYIETENNDTNDLNDTPNNISENAHSNHTNHQQTEFNNDALKFQVLEELPQQIKDYLSNFEIREIRIIKSVLLKGKKSFNNAHDTYYRLEDVEFELVSVLKRFKAMLLQKNETVEAMQGYLMQSIKAELEEIHALNMRRQNMPKYNIFNE
ncbi:replication initiator protein A [Staphylococcus cohnii]|uniref:replication initiator protein A n=1 Tax=Staphylococcus cohnii TaxID=29382 RepID=UPI00374F0F85